LERQHSTRLQAISERAGCAAVDGAGKAEYLAPEGKRAHAAKRVAAEAADVQHAAVSLAVGLAIFRPGVFEVAIAQAAHRHEVRRHGMQAHHPAPNALDT